MNTEGVHGKLEDLEKASDLIRLPTTQNQRTEDNTLWNVEAHTPCLLGASPRCRLRSLTPLFAVRAVEERRDVNVVGREASSRDQGYVVSMGFRGTEQSKKNICVVEFGVKAVVNGSRRRRQCAESLPADASDVLQVLRVRASTMPIGRC